MPQGFFPSCGCLLWSTMSMGRCQLYTFSQNKPHRVIFVGETFWREKEGVCRDNTEPRRLLLSGSMSMKHRTNQTFTQTDIKNKAFAWGAGSFPNFNFLESATNSEQFFFWKLAPSFRRGGGRGAPWNLGSVSRKMFLLRMSCWLCEVPLGRSTMW